MDIPELLAIFGPGIAGAVFGAGWWFWVDAVVCSSIVVSFVHYLPGISLSFFSLSSIFLPPKLTDFRVSALVMFLIRNICIFGGFDVQLCEERRHRLLPLRWWGVEVFFLFFESNFWLFDFLLQFVVFLVLCLIWLLNAIIFLCWSVWFDDDDQRFWLWCYSHHLIIY